MTVAIDWENLGFAYMKLPYRYIAHYKNGQWDQGESTEDATLHISESSPSLHYGQQAFEGLKAYRPRTAVFNCSVLTKMLSVCNVLVTVF